MLKLVRKYQTGGGKSLDVAAMLADVRKNPDNLKRNGELNRKGKMEAEAVAKIAEVQSNDQSFSISKDKNTFGIRDISGNIVDDRIGLGLEEDEDKFISGRAYKVRRNVSRLLSKADKYIKPELEEETENLAESELSSEKENETPKEGEVKTPGVKAPVADAAILKEQKFLNKELGLQLEENGIADERFHESRKLYHTAVANGTLKKPTARTAVSKKSTVQPVVATVKPNKTVIKPQEDFFKDLTTKGETKIFNYSYPKLVSTITNEGVDRGFAAAEKLKKYNHFHTRMGEIYNFLEHISPSELEKLKSVKTEDDLNNFQVTLKDKRKIPASKLKYNYSTQSYEIVGESNPLSKYIKFEKGGRLIPKFQVGTSGINYTPSDEYKNIIRYKKQFGHYPGNNAMDYLNQSLLKPEKEKDESNVDLRLDNTYDFGQKKPDGIQQSGGPWVNDAYDFSDNKIGTLPLRKPQQIPNLKEQEIIRGETTYNGNNNKLDADDLEYIRQEGGGKAKRAISGSTVTGFLPLAATLASAGINIAGLRAAKKNKITAPGYAIAKAPQSFRPNVLSERALYTDQLKRKALDTVQTYKGSDPNASLISGAYQNALKQRSLGDILAQENAFHMAEQERVNSGMNEIGKAGLEEANARRATAYANEQNRVNAEHLAAQKENEFKASQIAGYAQVGQDLLGYVTNTADKAAQFNDQRDIRKAEAERDIYAKNVSDARDAWIETNDPELRKELRKDLDIAIAQQNTYLKNPRSTSRSDVAKNDWFLSRFIRS